MLIKDQYKLKIYFLISNGVKRYQHSAYRRQRQIGIRDSSAPLRGRLEISDRKWDDMIQGLRDVVALPDPVGRISNHSVRPNGLRIGQMAIPLGVIAMIYESRPNVTVDAAALCVKAGNAVILRGGSEAIHSNLALGEELRAAARDEKIPEDAITIIPTTDRAAIDVLLKLNDSIDLVIPRGGAGLILKVIAESTIPVIAHDAGICHVFIDESADTQTVSYTKLTLSTIRTEGIQMVSCSHKKSLK